MGISLDLLVDNSFMISLISIEEQSLRSGACPGSGDAGGRRPLFEILTYNFC